MSTIDESLFWELVEELQLEEPLVEEGTIMGGRCARVAGEFLALVDFKGSGLVVKLPRARVQELIEDGVGQPFAPAGKVFKEWVSIRRQRVGHCRECAAGRHRALAGADPGSRMADQHAPEYRVTRTSHVDVSRGWLVRRRNRP